MLRLFKNAFILNLNKKYDILVEDDRIKSIKNEINGKFDDIVDLNGNIVMPPFVNPYLKSVLAFRNSYLGSDLSESEEEFVRQFIYAKNYLAGVCFWQDFEVEGLLLEDLMDKSEKELGQYCADSCRRKLFIKTGQSLQELGEINSKYKLLPSEVLEDFGLLDHKACIVGGNCFEKDELVLFSDYDSSFVLLPYDDGRSGRRFANLLVLKNLEKPIGIASGHYAQVDYFSYMRQLIMHNQIVMEEQGLVTEKDLVWMSTYGGAEILGLDIELKEGNFANFIVINDSFALENDIYKRLVWEKSKSDIIMTVKNGKIMQKNGQFIMESGLDYAKILNVIKQLTRR